MQTATADENEAPPRLFTPRYLLILAGLVIATVLAAYLAVRLTAAGTPDDDSADAGFLRDMGVHHEQAVTMALIIRDRTEDPLLQAMATDMVLTQTSEMGMMSGWLQVWDLSQTGEEPAMAWMGHPTTGRMPGMASPEEIQQLRDLPVAEAEVLFLRLMIAHHQSAIDMANACLDRCDESVVLRLARGVIGAQQGEIDTMRVMLTERGQDPDAPPAMPAAEHDPQPTGTPAG